MDTGSQEGVLFLLVVLTRKENRGNPTGLESAVQTSLGERRKWHNTTGGGQSHNTTGGGQSQSRHC